MCDSDDIGATNMKFGTKSRVNICVHYTIVTHNALINSSVTTMALMIEWSMTEYDCGAPKFCFSVLNLV